MRLKGQTSNTWLLFAGIAVIVVLAVLAYFLLIAAR
jgi:LPXTG-motif cell wall-anchored protein